MKFRSPSIKTNRVVIILNTFHRKPSDWPQIKLSVHENTERTEK